MNVANVTAGTPDMSGYVYIAAIGTTAPTDTSTLPSADWTELGYISDQGLVNANSPANNNVKEWGGNVVLSVLSEKPDTFKFKLLEVLNQDVLEVIYGAGNVSLDQNGMLTVSATADQATHYMWCFDMIVTGSKKKRIFIADGCLTSLAEIQYLNNDATGYDITITAYPNSSGVTHIEFIK